MRLVYLWLVGCWLLVACGETAVPTSPPLPTLSPQEWQGKGVFSQRCGSCHSTAPATIIVGPSLAGIGIRAETRVPDQDGRTYLFTSILKPDRYLVEGYENLMPTDFGKTLTGEELDAVVAYLMTLN